MKRFVTVLLLAIITLCFVSCYAGEKSEYKYNCSLPAGDENVVYPSQSIENSENAYFKTSEQAVSTFSADVDTASYTMMRKVLTQGGSFSYYKEAIRIEELVNYFDYDYTKPTGDDLFGVKAQISDCPWNPEAKLLVLGLAAKDAVQNTAGNNLVFLIDVSGSMGSQDKLPLLIKSFSYLISNLTAADRVSIVTYAGNERVVLEACEGNKHEAILQAVNSLKASGSTNGQSGLQKAYQLAESCFIDGGNNRIIMASDGDLNVGISTPEELKAYIETERGKGIYLSVLGFGDGNYRDGNMEALADNGNGVYYYIDSEREAERIFGDKLTSTLYAVANDVKLQLTFNPNAVKEYRLVGYENRLLSEEDFTDDTKDAGELGAGHTVTVCYELKLNEGALDSDFEWMKFACRWKNIGETESRLQETSIGTSAYTKTPDGDFRFVSAVAEFGLILKESGNISYYTTVESVRSILSDISTEDEYKNEFKEIVNKYGTNY